MFERLSRYSLFQKVCFVLLAETLCVALSLLITTPVYADDSLAFQDIQPQTNLLTLGDSESAYPDDQIVQIPAVLSSGATVKNVWSRLWGQSLYDTMAQISQNGWAKGSGGTVVVAASAGYWDALSASGVAGLEGKAPIFLTATKSLSAQTKSELIRIKPKKIIVAGGPSAVSNTVLSQIKAATGVAPTRIYGKTMLNTAEQLNRKYKGKWKDNTCILATSKGFYDALSASPIAYAKHYPIFLVKDKDTITADTLSAMKACGVNKVIVVGGTSVVSQKVIDTLKKNKIALKKRLWGQTLYDTSREIAKWAIQNGMSANNMGVATGKAYYDALGGAALCGKRNAVLVLVDSGKTTCISSFVSPNRTKIAKGYIFGGTKVVVSAIVDRLRGIPANPSVIQLVGGKTKSRITLTGTIVRLEDKGTDNLWNAPTVVYALRFNSPIKVTGHLLGVTSIRQLGIEGDIVFSGSVKAFSIPAWQKYVGKRVSVTGIPRFSQGALVNGSEMMVLYNESVETVWD